MDLNKRDLIEIKTETGKVQMVVIRVIRQTGKNKWSVSIEGSCRGTVTLGTQCYVFFKGAEIGAHFTKIREDRGICLATLDTIISIPEFWGEQT
jgi:hypothetical protein